MKKDSTQHVKNILDTAKKLQRVSASPDLYDRIIRRLEREENPPRIHRLAAFGRVAALMLLLAVNVWVVTRYLKAEQSSKTIDTVQGTMDYVVEEYDLHTTYDYYYQNILYEF